MHLPRARRAVLVLDPLLDPAAGDRTVRAHVVRVVVVHPVEYRLADAHRFRKELDLDAPRAVMTGAPLDRVDFGSRNPLQRLARLLPHVLHARVAGNVVADLAERLLELALPQ